MKVSVIIPVFNAERFIEDALESVFGQKNSAPDLELEVIIVDNGSTDATIPLIERRYGSSVLLAHEPRRGPSFARNKGIGLATAPFLAFLDADDLWLPGKLRDQCAVLNQSPELGMVFCYGVEFSDPPGAFPFTNDSRPYRHAGAMVARREVFERVGPFPELEAGEFIAWFGWSQTLQMGAHVLPTDFYRRRIHASNTTRDRQLLHGYTHAMRWLMERRRHYEEGHHSAP